MMKSTQTNKYETACFIQESPQSSEMNGYETLMSTEKTPYCRFNATLQTYNCQNRMRRRYSMDNVKHVVETDPRIQDLVAKNKWRGEWNHPNPEIKGQIFSDIRMTIPEPMRTSHFISKPEFINDKFRAVITTHPRTECGRAVTSEIIDIGSVPSFSVRVLGNMIPNASMNQPNIRVNKMITADLVDYPSHEGADADIKARIMESYSETVFLKELAKYCAESDETMKVVCESFEISPEEVCGITSNGSIIMEQCDSSRLIIPLKGDIYKEAMGILKSIR